MSRPPGRLIVFRGQPASLARNRPARPGPPTASADGSSPLVHPTAGCPQPTTPIPCGALRHYCAKSRMPSFRLTRRAAQVVLAASIFALAALSAQAAPSGGPRPGTGCGGTLWRLMTLSDPDRNKVDLSKNSADVSKHRQPGDALRVIGKVQEIRRRSGESSSGFDAVGVMVVDMANDGSPVQVLDQPDPVFPYSLMVQRVATEYAAAFSRL